ncbi:hypothetical protein KEJ51_07255 [Candidatus Bathyarchaeota archaeon]|nr:hypothetical protein [Candidatus Bathyarchaeota archaeon]MBS7628665.1 hypothetical protein [Candidatus Bathyarchaeota archaeon]
MNIMAGGRFGLNLHSFDIDVEGGGLSENFDTAVSSTIEMTLRLILGDRTAEALYSHISREYNIDRKSLASNIQILCKVLHDIFGDSGKVIQRVIVRSLCENMNIEYGTLPTDDLPSALSELHRLRHPSTAQ